MIAERSNLIPSNFSRSAAPRPRYAGLQDRASRLPEVPRLESQRGLSAATKLEDWIDYAIRSDCAPFSLAQFDNLAQKTRLSRLVVQAPWLCSLFRSRVVIARILMGFLYLAVLVPILNRFSAQARQE